MSPEDTEGQGSGNGDTAGRTAVGSEVIVIQEEDTTENRSDSLDAARGKQVEDFHKGVKFDENGRELPQIDEAVSQVGNMADDFSSNNTVIDGTERQREKLEEEQLKAARVGDRAQRLDMNGNCLSVDNDDPYVQEGLGGEMDTNTNLSDTESCSKDTNTNLSDTESCSKDTNTNLSDQESCSKDMENSKDGGSLIGVSTRSSSSSDMSYVNKEFMQGGKQPLAASNQQAHCDILLDNLDQGSHGQLGQTQDQGCHDQHGQTQNKSTATGSTVSVTSACNKPKTSNATNCEHSVYKRLDSLVARCRDISVVDDSKICQRLGGVTASYRNVLATEVKKCSQCDKPKRSQAPEICTCGCQNTGSSDSSLHVCTCQPCVCDCDDQVKVFSPMWDWTFPTVDGMTSDAPVEPGNYELEPLGSHGRGSSAKAQLSSSTPKSSSSHKLFSSSSSKSASLSPKSSLTTSSSSSQSSSTSSSSSSQSSSTCQRLNSSSSVNHSTPVPVVTLFNHSVNFWIMEID